MRRALLTAAQQRSQVGLQLKLYALGLSSSAGDTVDEAFPSSRVICLLTRTQAPGISQDVTSWAVTLVMALGLPSKDWASAMLF